MKYALLVLLTAGIAFAWFGPVRIGHEDRPKWQQSYPAITLGPGTWSNQPIYVVMKDDSMNNPQSALMFQKSTDAGRTWLPADVLVRRGHAGLPDITTDPDGNVYIVYDDTSYIFCVRSSDGGATWSEPVEVSSDGDRPHIAVDTAGNLVCAWGAFVSVSTDRGVTWGTPTRVDTAVGVQGVFVQPGTNHYLMAGRHDRPVGGSWVSSCYLYRSTDMGQTFQPGVRLDTFVGWDGAWYSDVVADAQHVICGYDNPAEARTLYTPSDTWGSPHFIGYSFGGPSLAISADGRVHAALMEGVGEYYSITYTSSFDHGVSWSFPEFISGDTAADEWDQDIAADSAGHAYIVWQKDPPHSQIWFATNNPAAIAEQPTQQPLGARPLATVVRNVLFLPEAAGLKLQAPSLLDISGRKVLDLKPGANDVRALVPGVCFVRSTLDSRQSRMTKVVISR